MTMGIGLITVEAEMFMHALHAPESSRYDLARTPVDSVHAALLLPDNYKVLGIAFDMYRLCYGVVVESEEIPPTPAGYAVPSVMPTYERSDGGHVSLVNIEVRAKKEV